MAVDPSIKDAAFRMFLAGYSAGKIAAKLRETHGDDAPHENTVRKWADDEVDGLTWTQHRDAVKAQVYQSERQDAVDKLRNIQTIMDGMVDIAADRLEEVSRRPVGSFAQEIFAVQRILSDRYRQLEDQQKALAEADINDLFTAIANDPILGPVFEERKSAVLSAYEEIRERKLRQGLVEE